MATLKVRHEDISLSLAQLQLELRDSENRVGRITTIGVENDIAVTFHDILADPPSPLVILPGDQHPGEGLEPDLEGTAYIEGDATDVVIYRASD
jgi:hypothetical protein